MPSVSLLDLPDLALRTILLKLKPTYFLNFAMCSKRCERIAMRYTLYMKPSSFRLAYDMFNSHFYVRFKNGSLLEVKVFKTKSYASFSDQRTLKNHHFMVKNDEYGYRTYWYDLLTGTIVLAEFLTNLFNIQLDYIDTCKSMIISDKCRNEKFLKMLSWMPSVPTLRITCLKGFRSSNEFIDEDNDKEKLIRIVEKNKNLKKLVLDFDTVDGPVEVDFSNSFYKNLRIPCARWLTLQSVYQMNCVSLNLDKSKFTSEDVNEILKKWKEGWNPSMESMSIDCDHSLIDTLILNQLNAVAENDVSKWRIKRESDGVFARIVIYPMSCELYVLQPSSEPPRKQIKC